ncbi:NAD(P)-binding domain protein [Metarhizium brunneum]
MSPPSTIESVAAKVFEKHGRVDYLVIAAGFILEGAVEEVSRQQVYDSFNTNVPRRRTVYHYVVTFGSLASWRGGAGFSIYAMTKACASSLAESLRDELAPFQIRAATVEPGYFRTSFLNAGVMVNAQKRIEVYNDEATPTGQLRKKLLVVDNNQPGDVVKGCEVLVDVLTGTGLAHGKDLPVRVVLGPDCERVIRDKWSQSLGILDEWTDAIRSTDHDPS